MKTVCRTLGLARSHIRELLERSDDWVDGPTHRMPSDDGVLLAELRHEIADLPSYGYRRACALVNRQRVARGDARVNPKRVYRVMAQAGLLLPKAPRRRHSARTHEGTVSVTSSDLRWCSDGLEIKCDSGQTVTATFAKDCCDREVMAWRAWEGKGLPGEPVREMLKRANMPLWELLGGFNPAVPCYAGGVDLGFPLDKLLAQTDANLKKGFRAIKMKVGRKNLSEDVARLKAMREHLGDGFPLMVDANMRWSADQAIRAARQFADYDPLWLEEPLIPDDMAGQARVVREGGLPIAAGENFRTLWEFKQLIECGGVTYPEPDVTNCGGITSFMKIGHLAESFNLPVTSHGAHDVTVQALAAVPNCSYLEAHGFGLDRYIAEPLKIEDGCAMAPSRPGHGIEFDWRSLEKEQA